MTWFKKYDVLTKLISVLIAAVLWFYVVSVNNFDKEVRFKDLTPSFSGVDEILASSNLTVVGSYTVDIDVSASRENMMALNKSDIKVVVDVSNVTSVGTYELPYTVSLPSSAYTVRNKNPQKLSVKFDEENIKVVPVKLPAEINVADGYVIDQNGVSITPRELRITGLQEEIDKISYVEILIKQKELKATVSGEMEYAFFDVEGKPVEIENITVDYDSVVASIPVLKTKELPLHLEINGSEDMRKYINYSITPETMLVAGEETVIEQLASIIAGSVNISDISSGMEKTFTVTPPEGIINLSGELNATAKIEFDGLRKKTVETTLIEVVNTYTLPSGYKIRPVTNKINVDILGTEESLAKISSANVRAVVDLQSTVLSKGTHPIRATIKIDGVEGCAVANVEDYMIYVEVS